jgi:UDP-N-acetylmuramoylalanine--D-glutamate ligase
MNVTIMGLGLNGGGVESARYLARHGAVCTVTDLKDEADLASSIEELEKLNGTGIPGESGDSRETPGSEKTPDSRGTSVRPVPFRYVLGRHETEDFSGAGMVIKNPGVRPDSPWLAAAGRIETDISLFLAACPARLVAVTGSKGKSGTASALHWVLAKAREAADAPLPGRAYLGGNITVSPLSFLDELRAGDDVVLELSSWQLGDLPLTGPERRGTPIKPRTAVITSIMPDHQDRYGGMEAYVNDKRIIYRYQDSRCATVACAGDPWGRSFLAETPGRPVPYTEELPPEGASGGWIDPATGAGWARLAGPDPVEILPPVLLTPGRHQKKNLLAAALALLDLGLPAPLIRESLGAFPGIEHRLEYFRTSGGVRFYNDTAATIPEAAAAAVEALTEDNTPLVLVAGGTDKDLDFGPLSKAAAKVRTLILLEGTGTRELIPLLTAAGISFRGPWDDINAAAADAFRAAGEAAGTADRTAAGGLGTTGSKAAVVLSPGCASFGMFQNEFDRGRQWKEAVKRL